MLRMIRTSGCTFPLSHLGAETLPICHVIVKKRRTKERYLRRDGWGFEYSCLKEICRAHIRETCILFIII
jgi:hypothetical protein